MHRIRTTLALATVLALAGCASEPVEDVRAADSALEEARRLDAATYASEEWQAASDARARLDAELAAQEDRFALFRSYGQARNLALETRTAAKSAGERAIHGKQRARDEASALLAQARDAHARAQQALESAPSGKGARADLAALRADASAIETTLAEMQQAFDAEDYLTAKARAEAAVGASEQVIRQIEEAKKQTGRV